MIEFSRIKRLPPYVFNITGELKMAARRRGEDIIDMSMGNPDGPTPRHIVDKLVEAAAAPDTHGYSVSKGIPRLRRAIATWYQRRYGVEFDPDSEAIVTIGSKEGLGAPDARDARSRRHCAGAQPELSDPHLRRGHRRRRHPLGAHGRADVDFFAELERAIRESLPKPKMMILGFPSNPTAQCVELDFFERVIALARAARHLRRARPGVCRHHLRRLQLAPSIMQVPGARDVAVEFFTMSKSYNMAGWRIGFMVGNKELVSRSRASRVITTTARSPRSRWPRSPRWKGRRIASRRSARSTRGGATCWRQGLHEAGWMVEVPKASMYIWAEIPEPYKALGSLEFAKKMLAEAKVAVSPGIGFGDYGDTHVRFALIENEQRIRQAVRGIKEMFRKDGLLAPRATERAVA